MKTKRNVQVAEEKTPGPNIQSEPQGNVANPVPSQPDPRPVNVGNPLPIDVSAINPQSLAMAEKFGVPVRQILVWAQSIEQFRQETKEQLRIIQEQLPAEIGKAIDQAITKARAEQPKPVAEMPVNTNNPGGLQVPAWSQAMPEIIGMIRDALKDQPQQTNILQELAMESLKEDISFTKTFKQAIKSKFASAATDDIVQKVTGA